MKDISECHVAILDAGTFIPLAECMSKKAKETSYYSPFEQEYLGIDRCVIGDGMSSFKRVDEYMEPDFFNSVDLWVFPDIGFGGFQRYLRSLGKLVWGSMAASDLELYRTEFIKVIKDVGLPLVNTVTIHGVTELSDHLRNTEDKWIKINRYRENMETWHHIDYTHSERELERLANVFGPLKNEVIFIVQDAINGDDESPVIEVGYDGWSVGGEFPESSYQGVELKNKLYLGSKLSYDDLPEQVRQVNEAFAPVLASYGYANFWANEIRIKDGVGYFIDPTQRMAGQTQEHILHTCTNLPEVILAGAQGELIRPKFEQDYAAEATLHYHPANESEGWKTFKVPESVDEWVKLYRCCYAQGAYQFPPHPSDELGVIIGNGDSIESAIDNLKDHFDELKEEPVSIDLEGFVDLIKQLEDAESEGVGFSDKPIPDPAIAIE